MTQLRENVDKINELHDLIREIEKEAYYSRITLPEASARVRQRRANPEAYPEPDPKVDQKEETDEEAFAEEKSGPENCASDQDLRQEFVRRAFEDFLLQVLGLNPKHLPETIYKSLFTRFLAQFDPQASPESFFQEDASHKSTGRHHHPEKPENTRLKDLYRQLVRRLHPDVRTNEADSSNDLWHEVQQAYQRGDVDRLEMLQALTDLHEGSTGTHLSYGQLRSALEELKSNLRQLQLKVLSAQREIDWGFSSKRSYQKIETKIRKSFDRDLLDQTALIAEMNEQLGEWEKTEKRRASPQRPSSRTKKSPQKKHPQQDEFNFGSVSADEV